MTNDPLKLLLPTHKGLAVYHVVEDQKIAQAELTGSWEKWLEEIRSGGSVKYFKAEISGYTRTMTNELLAAGSGLAEKLVARKEDTPAAV